MKRVVLWIAVAAALLAGIAVYQYTSGPRFDVTPDAQREIDKAMRR